MFYPVQIYFEWIKIYFDIIWVFILEAFQQTYLDKISALSKRNVKTLSLINGNHSTKRTSFGKDWTH